MSEVEIIKTVFGIMLTLGAAVLFLLAFKLYYKYLVQEARCTARTQGTVVRYTHLAYGGDSCRIHLPVVRYTAGGAEYKVVGPEYKYYKTTSRRTLTGENGMEYREDDQVFTINRTGNAFVRIYGNPIGELYPLHSQVDVWYDPENPKLSYVKRYCNKKWAFWLMLFAGVFVLAADLLILLLL